MGLLGSLHKKKKAAASAVLQTNVVGCWPLTANGNDGSPNGLNLTNTGGVTFDASGALINDPSQTLTHVHDALLALGDLDWTIFCRIKSVTIPGEQFIFVGKYGDGDDSYQLQYEGPGNPAFELQAGETGGAASVLSATDLLTSGFHTLCASYTTANKKIHLQVDGGTETTTTLVAQMLPVNEGDFGIFGMVGATAFYTGRLVIWTTAIDATARAWLRSTWNGTYSGLAAYTP